jgi:hypothetical protein
MNRDLHVKGANWLTKVTFNSHDLTMIVSFTSYAVGLSKWYDVSGLGSAKGGSVGVCKAGMGNRV